MSDDIQKPDDERNQRDEGNVWYKVFKGILVTLGVLAVGAILIVGLVLGACFLSARR